MSNQQAVRRADSVRIAKSEEVKKNGVGIFGYLHA